jgi:hypothetical protein
MSGVISWIFESGSGLVRACAGRLARTRLSSRCDTRRSILIIGPTQNDPDCVAQRKALKPLLMRVRNVGINVIEIYGGSAPRRNGTALQWLDGVAIRRHLRAAAGFHLFCLDDDGDIVLHGQRPVSERVLSELIAAEEPIALPAPDPTNWPTPEPPVTSWSVGVLR